MLLKSEKNLKELLFQTKLSRILLIHKYPSSKNSIGFQLLYCIYVMVCFYKRDWFSIRKEYASCRFLTLTYINFKLTAIFTLHQTEIIKETICFQNAINNNPKLWNITNFIFFIIRLSLNFPCKVFNVAEKKKIVRITNDVNSCICAGVRSTAKAKKSLYIFSVLLRHYVVNLTDNVNWKKQQRI